MAQIKSLSAIADKFTRVTPTRVADYEAGVQNPTRDWAGAAEAAKANYDAGVQKAVAEGRFAKGVRAAGTARWQEGAVQKGTQRWGPGVQLAGNRYQEGYAPIHQAISSLTLPPRRPRMDPGNMQRVAAVAKAAHEASKRAKG